MEQRARIQEFSEILSLTNGRASLLGDSPLEATLGVRADSHQKRCARQIPFVGLKGGGCSYSECKWVEY